MTARALRQGRAAGGRAYAPAQAGFTLMEVLVALVVLSVAVAAAIQLFGGGLRLVRASGDHLEATLLASAKLSELEAGPLEEGVAEGREGDYRWVRRVSLDPDLLPVEPRGLPPGPVPRLARLSVEVRWGSRRVELVTLRAWAEAAGGPTRGTPGGSPATPGPPGASPGPAAPAPPAPGAGWPRGLMP